VSQGTGLVGQTQGGDRSSGNKTYTFSQVLTVHPLRLSGKLNREVSIRFLTFSVRCPKRFNLKMTCLTPGSRSGESLWETIRSPIAVYKDLPDGTLGPFILITEAIVIKGAFEIQ
jgi:hypothetical protein